MAVLIVNITPNGIDPEGINDYELRINNEVLARFSHRRSDGLSACLRQAAAAYDEVKKERKTQEAVNLGWFSAFAE